MRRHPSGGPGRAGPCPAAPAPSCPVPSGLSWSGPLSPHLWNVCWGLSWSLFFLGPTPRVSDICAPRDSRTADRLIPLLSPRRLGSSPSLQAPGILDPSPSSGGVSLTSIGTDTLGEYTEGQQRVHEAQKAGGRGGGLQHCRWVGCHDAIWHPYPIGCCPQGDGEAEVPTCAVPCEAYPLAC